MKELQKEVKATMVTFRATEALLIQLTTLAAKQEMTRSKKIIEFIEAGIKKETK